jgi:hypothetical protein
MPEKTTFLNVDLDISSREDLAPLAAALEPRLFALHVGRSGRMYRARLELRTQPRSADAAIQGMVRGIQSLPRRKQECWKRATTRDFNIGIQAGAQPYASEYSVAEATVGMVDKVRGRITITVYGAGGKTAGRRATRQPKG